MNRPGATATSNYVWDSFQATVTALNDRGIGRGDRVAIVLPNGPEMASAFVAIAAGAATAPLNPAYRQPEFEFYLSDLGTRALVLAEGDDSPARAAAAALGVPVLEIHADPESPAGTFDFATAPTGATAAHGGMATPDDIALLLHTSGTTSRPKLVPLLHRNVFATAENIRQTLRLGRTDRCLNVMPLFHIHGLMACVLSTLHAGGSVYCAPGFNALKVFGWLADAGPTWYSAVPTMHQAIVARASRNREIVARLRLRFIRSSSAALPTRVMAELEDLFAAPVVEAYAMTEAAHQMTCNPLPPAPRKPGTAGVAAGPDVSVMDAGGHQLAPGRGGRDRHPGAERHPRLREQRGREPRGLHARVVPHRRSGFPRRGRVLHHHGAPQGDHQPGRGEDLAAGGRRGADGPPGRAAGGHLRDAAPEAGARRWPRRWCCGRGRRPDRVTYERLRRGGWWGSRCRAGW